MKKLIAMSTLAGALSIAAAADARGGGAAGWDVLVSGEGGGERPPRAYLPSRGYCISHSPARAGLHPFAVAAVILMPLKRAWALCDAPPQHHSRVPKHHLLYGAHFRTHSQRACKGGGGRWGGGGGAAARSGAARDESSTRAGRPATRWEREGICKRSGSKRVFGEWGDLGLARE